MSPYQQALRVSEHQAGLRVHDDAACAALGPPFCASDTRLVGPTDDEGWNLAYDCLCAACLEKMPPKRHAKNR